MDGGYSGAPIGDSYGEQPGQPTNQLVLRAGETASDEDLSRNAALDHAVASGSSGPGSVSRWRRVRRGSLITLGGLAGCAALVALSNFPTAGAAAAGWGAVLTVSAALLLRSRWARTPVRATPQGAAHQRRWRVVGWAGLCVGTAAFIGGVVAATTPVHPDPADALAGNTNCGSALFPRNLATVAHTISQVGAVSDAISSGDCSWARQTRQSDSLFLVGLGSAVLVLALRNRRSALLRHPRRFIAGVGVVSLVTGVALLGVTAHDRALGFVASATDDAPPATSCGTILPSQAAPLVPPGTAIGYKQTSPSGASSLVLVTLPPGQNVVVYNKAAFSEHFDGSGDVISIPGGGAVDITTPTGKLLHHITIGAHHAVLNAVLSPDHRRLAVVDDTNLVIVGLDGTPGRVIAHHADGLVSGPALAWSPNGQMIAYLAGDSINDKIAVINIDGTHGHTIAAASPVAHAPSWSPDSTQLAFEETNRVAIAHPDGSQLRVLPPAPGCIDIRPAWSPDGTRLAMLSFVDTAPGFFDDLKAVSVLDLATGVRDQLTPFVATADQPSWAPNSQLITFSYGTDPNHNIDTGPAAIGITATGGSSILALTPGGGHDRQPTWITPVTTAP